MASKLNRVVVDLLDSSSDDETGKCSSLKPPVCRNSSTLLPKKRRRIKNDAGSTKKIKNTETSKTRCSQIILESNGIYAHREASSNDERGDGLDWVNEKGRPVLGSIDGICKEVLISTSERGSVDGVFNMGVYSGDISLSMIIVKVGLNAELSIGCSPENRPGQEIIVTRIAFANQPRQTLDGDEVYMEPGSKIEFALYKMESQSAGMLWIIDGGCIHSKTNLALRSRDLTRDGLGNVALYPYVKYKNIAFALDVNRDNSILRRMVNTKVRKTHCKPRQITAKKNGKIYLCEAPNCKTRYAYLMDIDENGSPVDDKRRLCKIHGGTRMCVVAGCINKGRQVVQEPDAYGARGYRCKSHLNPINKLRESQNQPQIFIGKI